jgi:hypothetical protein
MDHLNDTSPQSFIVGTGALFTCVLHVRAVITQSSVLIKSQHIIIYCSEIFRTTLEDQNLLQSLCDTLQLVNKRANGALCDEVQSLSRHSLLSK